jgi:hypothetical protein
MPHFPQPYNALGTGLRLSPIASNIRSPRNGPTEHDIIGVCDAAERKGADAFLDGSVRLRSLAYFRDFEDQNVRQDKNEGAAVFRPADGLLVTNHTPGESFLLPGHAFELKVKQEEIFVLCTSRLLSEGLRKKFDASVCVEILKIKTFCERMTRAIPADATFRAGKVEYYDESEGGSPRWALPDLIAMSKPKSYQWQFEYRFILCFTDALEFEKGALRLVKGDTKDPKAS